jgi:hypothetical protein
MKNKDRAKTMNLTKIMPLFKEQNVWQCLEICNLLGARNLEVEMSQVFICSSIVFVGVMDLQIKFNYFHFYNVTNTHNLEHTTELKLNSEYNYAFNLRTNLINK